MRASKAWDKVHNNKEAVLWDRLHRSKRGWECTFCPPNHGENERGSISQWGRKAAKKREYATGKGRRGDEIGWIFQNHRAISIFDKRRELAYTKRRRLVKPTKADIEEVFDLYLTELKKNKRKIVNDLYLQMKRPGRAGWRTFSTRYDDFGVGDEVSYKCALQMSHLFEKVEERLES